MAAVEELYMGIVYFMFLSVLWLLIFNAIKTAKVKFFFIVYGIVLLLLAGISSYYTVTGFQGGSPSSPYVALGSLLAHITFAIYAFYTGLSSVNPFNTNQKVVVYTSAPSVPAAANATAQKGGKTRKH